MMKCCWCNTELEIKSEEELDIQLEYNIKICKDNGWNIKEDNKKLLCDSCYELWVKVIKNKRKI